ncbi:MAG: serine hydrolase domain-containing protein [Geminicoccales bacterium]
MKPNPTDRLYYAVMSSLLALCLCSGNSAAQDQSHNAKPDQDISCASVGLGEDHINHEQYQSILDAYASVGFPGITAAIFTPNEGLWIGASGFADLENKVPMVPCNVLFSGSVAKMYTVVGALHLTENRAFRLRDRIARFLPDEIVENLPNAQQATITQLMNHTAGMPDHDDEEGLEAYVRANEGRLPSAEEQLAFLYDNEPLFKPGTSAAYSSAHTLALSLVMDHAIEGDHADVVSSAIINKLGLKETFYKNEPNYPRPDRLVKGYFLEDDDVPLEVTDYAVNYADGSRGDAGIIASAHDYFHFIKGVVEGRVLHPRTVRRIVAHPRYVFDDGTFALGFGLGVFTIKKDDKLVKVGHSGSTLGGTSHVYYYPTTGSYIVLLTNMLFEDNEELLRLWGSELLVGTSNQSIMSELENLVLN